MIRAAALALALGGCTPVAAPGDQVWGADVVPKSRDTANRCRPDGLDAFRGRQAVKAVTDEARRRSGASYLRVIGPETVVTADYREDRLNINVDAAGRITSLVCH